jgi:CMP-N-acetylneuraminic acid synthetase
MINKKNCLTIITARGGSKGLKNKNIKKIGNKTLIEFKYIASMRANILNNEIFVSTDSSDYIKLLKKKNIKCIKRPKYLATDTSETKPVLLHVLDTLKKVGKNFDNLILLEPATPFTSYKNLRKAYELFTSQNLDVMASVEESIIHSNFIASIKKNNLRNMFEKMKKLKKYRRQNFSKEYKMDGGFYIFKVASLYRYKNLFDPRQKARCFIVNKKEALNIESQEDFDIATLFYKNFHVIRKNFL